MECCRNIAFRTAALAALSFLLIFYSSPAAMGVTGGENGPPITSPVPFRLPLQLPIQGYGLIPALDGRRFNAPVAVASVPGETNRLFVVERPGRILVFTNLTTPEPNVFLDVQSQTYSKFAEAGLLGLAFHPGHGTNGYFYTFRSLYRSTPGYVNTLHQQVSRFQIVPTNPNQAEPASELALIAQADSSEEHNGGDLHFGPDGYLYVSFGETGPPDRESSEQPQRIDNGFFGAIARIDVDQRPDSLPPNTSSATSPWYGIPPDNPFVGAVEHNGRPVDPAKVRTEFYATGLRNPWRMSFDPETGTLFCGDVGGSDFEEINIIQRGGNYGWPYLEAALGAAPPEIVTIPPLLAYSHGYSSRQGLAVVGGLVYRGKAIPSLSGAYVFADYGTGNIWALRHWESEERQWDYLTADRGIAALGVDPSDGEILTVNHMTGEIKKLVYVEPSQPGPVPFNLADTGIFADLKTLEPVAALTPYTVNVPFWSDQAEKSRWFAMPNDGSKLSFDSSGNWQFPAGTTWVKHFGMQLTKGDPETTRRLETRVLVKTPAGVYGLSYRWERSLTNAVLVPEEGADEEIAILDGGITRTQTWHFPSRSECLYCHTPEAGFALGFNTGQLNRSSPLEDGLNQLQAWRAQGCFADPPEFEPAKLPKLAVADDRSVPLAFRARSYLAVNCSPCHQPGASAGSTWDARLAIPLTSANLINAQPIFTLDVTADLPLRRLTPRSVDSSMIIHWMNRRGVFQMPPVASNLVDTNGIELLSAWINSFLPEPWLELRYGPTSLVQAYAAMDGDGVVLGAAGEPGVDPTNSAYADVLAFPANGQWITRVEDFQAASPAAKAGLTARIGLGSDDPFLSVLQGGDGSVHVQRRVAYGAPTEVRRMDMASSNGWLRILRHDSNLVAYVSADHAQWSVAATLPFGQEPTVYIGPAITPSDTGQFTQGRFSRPELMSASIIEPLPEQPFSSPGQVTIHASVTTSNSGPVRVEFLADLAVIGTASAAPYEFVWKDPSAGLHQLRVRVSDATGTSILSQPVPIVVFLAEAVVRPRETDFGTLGNWAGVYGSGGYFMAGLSPALGSIQIELGQNELQLRPDHASDESALQSPVGASRIASAWTAHPALSLGLHLNDAGLYNVALYFAAWDDADAVRQQVRVFDALSGTLLDTRSLEPRPTGQYLVWTLRGDIRIEITSLADGPAWLNGLFVDPAFNRPPTVTLKSLGAERAQLPVDYLLEAEAADADGAVGRVEFWDGVVRLGSVSRFPFAVPWPNATVGPHHLVARAFDDLGDYADSAPVDIELEGASPAVNFRGTDPLTQGDWQTRFRRAVIPGTFTNAPASVSLRFDRGDVFDWGQSLEAPQALQHPTLPLRMAASWSGDEIKLQVAFADGLFHPVALYFLDWDQLGRVQEVTFANPDDDTILDQQLVSDFSGGQYFYWDVRGSAAIAIRPKAINAVLSGVFFDPIPTEFLTLSWVFSSDPARVSAAVRAPVASRVEMSASVDLVNWMPFATNSVPGSGVLLFKDLIQPDLLRTFYRAAILPEP